MYFVELQIKDTTEFKRHTPIICDGFEFPVQDSVTSSRSSHVCGDNISHLLYRIYTEHWPYPILTPFNYRQSIKSYTKTLQKRSITQRLRTD